MIYISCGLSCKVREMSRILGKLAPPQRQKKKKEKNQSISGEETGKARSSRLSNCAFIQKMTWLHNSADLVPRLIIQLEEGWGWGGGNVPNYNEFPAG